MRLAELQQSFWNAVRTRGAPPEGVDTLFTSGKGQSAAERLAVYHLAYWQRQLAALGATFPRTQALLGSRFERLVFGYVEARPCREPCIERLGAGFPEFLAARADVTALALGVARLEWAASLSLLSANPSSVAELPRLLGAKLADCRLLFVPSLQLQHVPSASQRWFRGEATDASDVGDSSSIDVAFFRPELAVRHVTIGADEARAHALARGGGDIALVCTAFSALPSEQQAPRALAVLSGWFTRGWVAACHS
jgi:hypothetical protein